MLVSCPTKPSRHPPAHLQVQPEFSPATVLGSLSHQQQALPGSGWAGTQASTTCPSPSVRDTPASEAGGEEGCCGQQEVRAPDFLPGTAIGAGGPLEGHGYLTPSPAHSLAL